MINNEKYQHLLVENRKKLLSKWQMMNLNEIDELVKRESPFDRSKHYIPL